jgi:hypothetical protein
VCVSVVKNSIPTTTMSLLPWSRQLMSSQYVVENVYDTRRDIKGGMEVLHPTTLARPHSGFGKCDASIPRRTGIPHGCLRLELINLTTSMCEFLYT